MLQAYACLSCSFNSTLRKKSEAKLSQTQGTSTMSSCTAHLGEKKLHLRLTPPCDLKSKLADRHCRSEESKTLKLFAERRIHPHTPWLEEACIICRHTLRSRMQADSMYPSPSLVGSRARARQLRQSIEWLSRVSFPHVGPQRPQIHSVSLHTFALSQLSAMRKAQTFSASIGSDSEKP